LVKLCNQFLFLICSMHCELGPGVNRCQSTPTEGSKTRRIGIESTWILICIESIHVPRHIQNSIQCGSLDVARRTHGKPIFHVEDIPALKLQCVGTLLPLWRTFSGIIRMTIEVDFFIILYIYCRRSFSRQIFEVFYRSNFLSDIF